MPIGISLLVADLQVELVVRVPHCRFSAGEPSAAEWSEFAGCHCIGSHHPSAGTGNDLSNIIENEYQRSSPSLTSVESGGFASDRSPESTGVSPSRTSNRPAVVWPAPPSATRRL